ncbi:Chondroadherin-like protein like [Argiope bruennichi]|uniref:Chondroadherin-like protein like n=1 Tax=Argiope bruennichi TaxID=94029 RepID=A0A8T0FTH5_ARGBR|nr:Chondroadherin-like protein like [Argiope bruennichi]
MLDVIILTLFIALTTGCPPPEDIHPCTCSWPATEDAYITCSNLDNELDLVQAASSLTRRSYVYSFVIQNSIFNYIPSDAFKGLKFVELEIKDTSLMALTDTDLAFEGLENHLQFLLINNCTIMNGWDWSIFRNLKKLVRLDVIYANLDSIEDLGQIDISKIMDINFSNNLISFIHPFAFSSFKKLTHLYLKDNAIREMKRTMLPKPALELLNLDFSGNEIEQFPTDMFVEMPQLESLSVANNKLLVLDEKVFAPVWETLQAFSAMRDGFGMSPDLG